MAASVETFEARLSELCDTVLALQAQINRLSVQTWSSANGAGYEGVYFGAGIGPDDRPILNAVQAQMTQSEAGNAISALNSVSVAIVAASAALAIAAEFNPNLLQGA